MLHPWGALGLVVAFGLSLVVRTTAQPFLTTLPELDALHSGENEDNNIRQGNVDVMSSSYREEIAICHLPYVFALSSEGSPWNALGSYEGGVSIALAAQHLNAGDGSIVPEVAGLKERCNIRFTMDIHDTELQESVAVDQIIRITDREPDKERLPCAILGAARSAVSVSTSLISGLRGYPQVSPISTSSALDDKSQYPLFGRTVPSDDGTAVAFVLYMRDVLNVRNLAVVYESNSYGNAFARGIQHAKQQHAPEMNLATFDLPSEAAPTRRVIEQTVADLKGTQYMYFFGILSAGRSLDDLMIEAYKQGIAGTGKHNWFYSDGVGSGVIGRPFKKDSPLGLAFRGTSKLSATGSLPGMPAYDRFSSAMKALKNEEDLKYILSKLPTSTNHSDEKDPIDYTSVVKNESFLESSLGMVAPFLYDAVIALGLAACEVAEQETYFDGRAHFDAMVNSSFKGVSGDVVFNPTTGTRDAESALFLLENFVDDEDTSRTEVVQFKSVQSSVFQGGEWIEMEPYMFNDGTSNIASDLPELSVEENHLTTGLRAVSLALCGTIILLSIGFALWTFAYKRARVVRASQPIFLHIICAGTIIMGLSIIPFSIDGGVASQQGCNIACASTPWLLCIGFSLVFSALFTKTHRINIIMKHSSGFKRVKVTPFDVAKPMIAILGANILVLSLWTALSPSYYDEITVSVDNFGRSTKTYGVCTAREAIPFLVTLAVINIGALVFALYEAYMARDISTEFHESAYIFKAMILILQVCFIGIPVLIIARENPHAHFFLMTGMVFVVCCSVLLLIFVPKIVIHRNKTRTLNSLPERDGEDVGVRFVNRSKVHRELVEENRSLKNQIMEWSNRI